MKWFKKQFGNNFENTKLAPTLEEVGTPTEEKLCDDNEPKPDRSGPRGPEGKLTKTIIEGTESVFGKNRRRYRSLLTHQDKKDLQDGMEQFWGTMWIRKNTPKEKTHGEP